jgi:hypothetical protein
MQPVAEVATVSAFSNEPTGMLARESTLSPSAACARTSIDVAPGLTINASIARSGSKAISASYLPRARSAASALYRRSIDARTVQVSYALEAGDKSASGAKANTDTDSDDAFSVRLLGIDGNGADTSPFSDMRVTPKGSFGAREKSHILLSDVANGKPGEYTGHSKNIGMHDSGSTQAKLGFPPGVVRQFNRTDARFGSI